MAVFGFVGDGGFEGGVGGLEDVGFVFFSGLIEESVPAVDFSVGFVGGIGRDGFEGGCGCGGIFEAGQFSSGACRAR